MIKSAITEFFNGLVEDEASNMDSAFVGQLFDSALEALYGERDFEILKKKDATQKWSAGDTSATPKTLPTDFVSFVAMYLVGCSIPIRPVPFEKQEEFKDYRGKFFIDLALGKFYMTGTTAQEYTINLFYIHEPAALTDSEEPLFPERFHKLIAYYMVAQYYNIDFDDLTLMHRLGEKHFYTYQMLRQGLMTWDSQLKTQAYNGTKQ